MADTPQELLKKRMLDVYSQDPAVRIPALAAKEPIKDATAEPAATAMMGTAESVVPTIAYQGYKSLQGLGNLFQNHSTLGQIGSGIFDTVRPWVPGQYLLNQLKNRFPRP